MRTITALLLVLTAAASIFILPRLVPPASPSPVIIHSQGPTVQTLQRLSHLVTTKVLIADILVGEGKGCRGSWLLKGDAILAVELAQAKVTDKHEDTKQATIILPEPVVLQPRIDHSRTRTWSVERVAWLPWSARIKMHSAMPCTPKGRNSSPRRLLPPKTSSRRKRLRKSCSGRSMRRLAGALRFGGLARPARTQRPALHPSNGRVSDAGRSERGGRRLGLLFIYHKPQGPSHLDVCDQATFRAAFAADEREGKDRMGGSSAWSKAAGFAVLLATLRRHP